MAFIHEHHPRSQSALAVTITREIHISSEKHERNNSMSELMSPDSLQIEKPKHNRWKPNPHPDNIVLSRKPPQKKKQPPKHAALDPVDLTRRLNDHIREQKLKENGGPGSRALVEMDWDKLRRAPRINHSRAGSRLEIRKEPHSQVEVEAHDYYMGPRPAPPLPQAEQDAAEQYQTNMWTAHRQFSSRTESASTGLFQHSQFRGTPLRKDSDATGTTGFYTESIKSCETSRTSSRGSEIVGTRIKSFQGLPPLLFQTQSDELFNTRTTLSLESTFNKLELAVSNSSISMKSIHESNALTSTKSIQESIVESVIEPVIEPSTSVSLNSSGRDTFGGRINQTAPTIDPEQLKKLSMMTESTITPSNRTTRTQNSGETVHFVMRQSAFPQEAVSQRNIHPLHRVPTSASDRSLDHLDRMSTVESQTSQSQHSPALTSIAEPIPILILHSAPSQCPPHKLPPMSLDTDRGRTLQTRPASNARSQSSDETYKSIHQQVSYSYWRASRPESWGPGEEGDGHDDAIDSYYLMDESKAAATAHMRQDYRRFNDPHKGPSSPQHAGAIQRVLGFFPKTHNSNKPILGLPTSAFAPPLARGAPPREQYSASGAREDERHYNLRGVLPDDFPMQRKNFLGLFTSKK